MSKTIRAVKHFIDVPSQGDFTVELYVVDDGSPRGYEYINLPFHGDEEAEKLAERLEGVARELRR